MRLFFYGYAAGMLVCLVGYRYLLGRAGIECCCGCVWIFISAFMMLSIALCPLEIRNRLGQRYEELDPPQIVTFMAGSCAGQFWLLFVIVFAQLTDRHPMPTVLRAVSIVGFIMSGFGMLFGPITMFWLYLKLYRGIARPDE